MSKLVRAKHPTTGAEFTTSEVLAKRAKATIVDKPTHDRHGRILPPKPATDKAGEPKTAATKEGSK